MIPITWVLSDDGLPGSGIDNATLTTELTAAFDTWEALPTSALDFTFGGEVPVRSSGLGGPLGASIDGLNLITFTDPGLVFPPGVLAVALTSSFTTDTVVTGANDDLDGDGNPDIPQGTYPAGTIFDGDISFNSSEDWSTSGSNNTRDIRRGRAARGRALLRAVALDGPRRGDVAVPQPRCHGGPEQPRTTTSPTHRSTTSKNRPTRRPSAASPAR